MQKVGRGQDNFFEPTQFSVKRIYRVQWKKQGINLDELAKLDREESLTLAELAQRLGVGKTSIVMHLRKVRTLSK